MNLYEVNWNFPGGWKLKGKVEAESHADAATRGRKNAEKVLEAFVTGMSSLRHAITPTVHLLKSNSSIRYRVKSVHLNSITGEKREHTVPTIYRTRRGAQQMADSLRGVYIGSGTREKPESRTDAEVLEVSA